MQVEREVLMVERQIHFVDAINGSMLHHSIGNYHTTGMEAGSIASSHSTHRVPFTRRPNHLGSGGPPIPASLAFYRLNTYFDDRAYSEPERIDGGPTSTSTFGYDSQLQ